jgi:hypothetical protein
MLPLSSSIICFSGRWMIGKNEGSYKYYIFHCIFDNMQTYPSTINPYARNETHITDGREDIKGAELIMFAGEILMEIGSSFLL